jgi:hypothetical protein
MWVTVEVALDSGMGDSPHEAFDLSKRIADEWYNKNGGNFNQYPILYPAPGAEPLPAIQVSKPEVSVRIGLFVEDINSCKDLITLHTYKLLVRSDEKLREAYQKKEKELMNNLTQDERNG